MPKGSRKVQFTFDETHLTHFGGMWLIQRFCNKLHLRHLLQRYILTNQSHLTYDHSELLLALLYSIMTIPAWIPRALARGGNANMGC